MNRLFRTSSSLFTSLAMLSFLVVLQACSPSDPLEEIRQEQARGQLEPSIEKLRVLLAERQGDAELLYLYGQTLSLSGRAGLAEWALREAMRDPEWLVPAGMQLATDLARSRNFEMAIEIATAVLEAEPDSIDALLIRASANAHSRMFYEEALADVARVLELEPDNIDVMEPQILSLLALDRIDEVATAMDELGRKIDENDSEGGAPAWHCATTAIFADESGDLELAKTRWANCLESHPSNNEVVLKSLPFYDKLGQFDRSVEILQTAVEANPTARGMRVNLAGRLRAWGKADEAEALLKEGTEFEIPQLSSAGWLDLAKHYQMMEDYPAAAETMGRAVEIVRTVSSPQPTLLLEYADALLIAGEYERSLEVADSMTFAPHQEMIRARVAQESGDYTLALKHFEVAFQLWPDNPFARYYAALASESIGDFDRAIEQYRYSIRISPGATDSRTRVARIHLAEDRPGAGIQLLRIKAHEEALEPEGELLSFELWSRVGRAGEIHQSMEEVRTGAPIYVGRALARVAKGLRDRSGAAAAVKSLRASGGIVVGDLNYIEAIRVLVEYGHEAGEMDGIREDLDIAVAAHPDAASAREVVAFDLELSKAASDDIRSAYNRVLEVEPENARGLAGLGRLARAEGDHEAALSYFDRAVAADSTNAHLQVQAARELVALDRGTEAEDRITVVLGENQFDAGVTTLLTELHLARGESSEQTANLAQRAVRFGGGAHAQALLEQVEAARGGAAAVSP